ncbi:MAG: 50S ribosomal protein L13 [Methanoculleus sp. SDB]|nr:MAG: 50S ribosomal protein L13 [Methanoculleus sp. SDB]
MVTVIDADGLLLGRLASIVAKRTLMGEEIAIINAERTVISGSKVTTFNHYDTKVKRGSREGGPFFPRRPDHIVKRTIRGMLPYKRQRGAEAFRRVRVYVGIPREFADIERETIEEAHVDRLSNPRFVTLGTVSTRLGAKF